MASLAKRGAQPRNSTHANPLRHLYGTARWAALRQAKLSESPLCWRCLAIGVVEPATVVHHKVAHRGDVAAFWAGPFETLCKVHHDRDGKLEDHGKAVPIFGDDGWPIE